MARQQVGVGGAGGLRVARRGEHGAVGRGRGGGLSRHLLVGRQLQGRQETWGIVKMLISPTVFEHIA